jgi:hypothetical protein
MMSTLSTTSSFGRPRFGNIADGLVVALAVSLPCSTSATSILLVLWLFSGFLIACVALLIAS